jgi:hypothetical protein
MNGAETTLTIALSVMGVIVFPTLLLAFRAAIRWKGIEDKLGEVVTQLQEITEDEHRVHAELNTQMREDRNATNLRLRWLEENLWKGKP